MTDYADFEISLHQHETGRYVVQTHVEFRTQSPQADDEIRHGEGYIDLDVAALRALPPDTYGQALSLALFADPALRVEFEQVRAIAKRRDLPLRLRLAVGRSARELHALRWELLRDPQDDTPLCTHEQLFFSRYLSSQDWRPVRLRAKGTLRALAVIADPPGLDEWGLAAVDVARERERVCAGLNDIPVTFLGDEGKGHVSLHALTGALRAGDYDIVYLIGHGKLDRKGEAWLWLEDATTGHAAQVAAQDVVDRIRDLAQRPRLVVLASCESAGDGVVAPMGDALAALGPRLAQAGVPAVLAMQGNVSMDTVARFMPVFFAELQRDGQIDRAVAVARSAIRDCADYWAPALYMRLRSGRIWYVPGFGNESGTFEKWPALLQPIADKRCTPILGHGLVEPFLGSLREIAQEWAQEYHYPLARHERESLPRVAQYLTIYQDEVFPYSQLEERLCRSLQSTCSDKLPEPLRQGRASLKQLIDVVGRHQRATDPYEPHKVLAQLDLPIYITVNVDHLLVAALEEAGKTPQVCLCPWNDAIENDPACDAKATYLPDPEHPLVYHLFGNLDQPDSLVLTEDDYFDYLIGFTKNKDLIPPRVLSVLTNSALLFLGFPVDDWSFRVLLRSVLSGEGSRRRRRYQHVAAQIEPDEERLLDPERALRYLDQYFSGARNRINLYWGSVHDFMAELLPRWTQL